MPPFQYLYGPVNSWRLGVSLGVDPLSTQSKACNMNCIYCQLGKTAQLTNERKDYISVDDLMREIGRIPASFIDYITFSGRGEPTLAKNLGAMIRTIKKSRREHVAVITNTLLMADDGVREDLLAADFVLAKLDAGTAEDLAAVNGCAPDLFEGMVEGLCSFRSVFKGKLALQVMVVENNYRRMEEIARIAWRVKPDEVELNTPLRPCAVTALEPMRIDRAKSFFQGLPVVGVYDKPTTSFVPWDEPSTALRHGQWRKTKDY